MRPEIFAVAPPAPGPAAVASPATPPNLTFGYFTLLAGQLPVPATPSPPSPDAMVQAACEYLTWQAGHPVALSAVALFLRQEWWQVLARLREYASVMPLVARAQHVANVSSLFNGSRPDRVFEAAYERVMACLALEQGHIAPLPGPAATRPMSSATHNNTAAPASPAATLAQWEEAVTRREQALELQAGLQRLYLALALVLGGLLGAGVMAYLGSSGSFQSMEWWITP